MKSLEVALAIGDLVHARNRFKSGLGVLVKKTNSRITIIDREFQIMNFHASDVDLQCPKWGYKTANPINRNELPVGRSLQLMSEANLQSALVPLISALFLESIGIKKTLYAPVSEAHRKLSNDKQTEVPLSKISKLISDGSSELSKLLALKAVLRGGIYFVLQTPVADPEDPIYTVRPLKEVEFILRVREDIRKKNRPTLFSKFIIKMRKIIELYRNGVSLKEDFTKYDMDLINLIRSALRTPMHISEVESEIAVFGVLKSLKLYGDKPRTTDIPLFLIESGVFSPNEDLAIYSPGITRCTNNLEYLSEVGNQIIAQADSFAQKLISDPKFSEPIIPKHDSKPVLEYKKEAVGNFYENTPFYNQDPLASLRTEVHQPVFAIDSPTAHEIDDGISLEERDDGDWIHIHIADPTSIIPPEHPLARISQLRSNTLYLCHRHFPLMPEYIGRDLLNLGVSPLAFTFSGKLDDNGNIVDYKVSPSFLRNVKFTTYEKVNTVLNWNNLATEAPFWCQNHLEKSSKPQHPSFTQEDVRILQKLQILTWKHRSSRIRNGAFEQDQFSDSIRILEYPVPVSQRFPKYSFQCDDVFNKKISIALDPGYIPSRSPSQVLVSESMILAGCIAAKYCQERKLDVSYRCQKPILDCNTEEVKDLLETALESRNPTSGLIAIENIEPLFPYMFPAYMSANAESHSGLGIHSKHETAGYLKVTSPLRRYQDMLVHYQISRDWLHKRPVFNASQVLQITARGSLIEQQQKILSKRSNRYWTLMYLLRKCYSGEQGFLATVPAPKYTFRNGDAPQQPFVGIVSIQTAGMRKNYYVKVPELRGLCGTCIMSTDVEHGQIINCIVEEVSPLSNTVIFRQI